MKNIKKTNKLNTCTVWNDMDGLMVEYTAKDFKNGNTKWMQPGYFRNLKPDTEMVNLFRALMHIKERHNKTAFVNRVNVLTTILHDNPYNKYQHKDKVDWMEEYVFDNLEDKKACYYTKFTTHDLPKPKTAEKILGRKLEKTDILLDDYNANLLEWANAGGTAIKYINGLNNPDSWNGPKLFKGTTTKEKVDYIYNLINNDDK